MNLTILQFYHFVKNISLIFILTCFTTFKVQSVLLNGNLTVFKTQKCYWTFKIEYKNYNIYIISLFI
jgi:hypothetical protein